MTKIKYRILYCLWTIWHVRLREYYGYDGYHHKSRPMYHLCCNGNSGGWRTDFCVWLEHRWRALEDKL